MKNEMLTVLILLLVADLIVLAVLMWTPVMRREKSFFGVRVSREMYVGEGRRILRRYWLCLAAIFIALEAVGLLTAYYRNNFLYAAATYVASLPLAFGVYTMFAREVRPFRLPVETTKFASSLRTRRLADYTSILLEIATILMVVAPTVALIYYYPALPERIPVHWGFNGEPDRWARKTFSAVFFLPVLAGYMQSWFLLLKYDMVHAKMTLPAAQAEIHLKYKEQMMTASMRLMDWARGTCALLLGIVSLFILLTTLEPLRHLMPYASAGMWAGLAMLFISGGYYVYRLMVINNELEEATGETDARRESEEEKWSGGGMFYYNPDDPALIVEKKDGLGYTYNFAGKGIRLRLMFLGVVPLLVLWALLDL